MRKFLSIHGPYLFCMLLITVASSISNVGVNIMVFSFADKFVHFFVFGVLGFFLARGIDLSNASLLKKNFFLSTLIIGAAFSASDEIHQAYVPGRFSDITDWIADVAGIFAFFFIYKYYKKNYALKDLK